MTGILTLDGFTDVGAQALHAAEAHRRRHEELRRAGLSDDQARAELQDFLDYAHSTPWTLERPWRNWQIQRQPVAPEPVTRWRPSIFGHDADVAAGRVGYYPVAPCACHPSPFPAARDYRRRTRHRNRRRKS